MERAEIHELSAAYALDALDADELKVFEEHLARCPECRENVAAFHAASAELAYDTYAPEPPRGLRERILEEAARERPKVVELPRRAALGNADRGHGGRCGRMRGGRARLLGGRPLPAGRRPPGPAAPGE